MAYPNYVSITVPEVSSTAPFQQKVLRAIRDNPLAFLGGTATAPFRFLAAAFAQNTTPGSKLQNLSIPNSVLGGTITNDKIKLNSIKQAELSLAVTVLSSAGSPTVINYNPPITWGTAYIITNGEYLTGWQIYSDNAANYYTFAMGYYPLTNSLMSSYASRTWVWAGLDPARAGVVTFTVYTVSASPPYNLGHGDVPLFILADVDSNGDPISLMISTEPPWWTVSDFPGIHYGNDGKTYWKRPSLPCPIEDGLHDPELRDECLRVLRSGEHTSMELTPANKNNRINERPHPFGNPHGTVVMVEPTGRMMDDLAILHAEGQPINQLFHDGDIRLGNQSINAGGPKSIQTVRANWR